MENALIKLKESVRDLSKTEKIVGEYILANLDLMANISIQDLAEKTQTSTSAIIRMSRSLGFEGFKDFKQSLIGDIALEENNKTLPDNQIYKDDNLEDIINKITLINVQSLMDTKAILSTSELKKAVELLKKSKNVILFGLGASLVAARDMYLKLARISKPCIINDDWHLQLLSAINSTQDDVAIVFSYSGQTEEVIKCMKALKDNKTPIIAITRCVETKVFQLADIKLYTTSNESLFRSAAMSSRISALNLVDILYTGYANSTYNYTTKQLKKTHINKKDQ